MPEAPADKPAPEADDARYMRLMAEAQALAQRGAFTDALARVAEAETLFGPENPNSYVAAFTRGQLLMASGRAAEAEKPFVDAIAALDKFSDVPPLARFLMSTNLALLYQRTGRNDAAEALFVRILEEGERLARVNPPDPEAASIVLTARNNLGMHYTAQGRHAEAESVLQQALLDNAALPKEGQAAGRLLVIANLANVYFYQRRFELAEPLLLEVAAAGGPFGSAGNDGAFIARNNLASLYVAQGRYADAEPILVRSRDEREARGRDLPETIMAVNNLADLYRRQGRFADAEPLLERVLDASARQFGEDNLVTANVAANLALLRLAVPGEAARAIDPARRFIAALRSFKTADPSQTFSDAQRERELGVRAYGYSLLADADWAAAAARPAERASLTAEAFTALQEATAGTAGRAVVQMAVRRLADQTRPALGALVRERETLARDWAVNSAEYGAALANSGPEIETLKQDLRAAKARIDARMAAIDAILRNDFPNYFALVRPNPLDVAAAQALLADDEAILMVVPTELGTHVLGVSRTGIEWVRSPWTRDQVDAAVRTILVASGATVRIPPGATPETGSAEGGFPRRTAFNLYQQIVAPVGTVLAGKRHLFVVAGGSLTSLPFAILVTAEPQGNDRDPQALRRTPWFAEAHALIQIPSIQSLEFLRRPGAVSGRAPPVGGGFVGFGNPLLGGTAVERGLEFSGSGVDQSALFRPGRTRDGRAIINLSQLGRMSRLPGTAIELEYIRASLNAPNSALFLGERATEANVRSTNFAGARIIAFATHGLLAGMVSESGEPGLVFTPPATASEADDGYLTAAEVSALQLDADWVILSACNTAAGDGSEGALGLSGLARAFFYAGARNLLASHWPVRDDVAAQITVRTIQISACRTRTQPGGGLSAGDA